ncbi:MAG TPA: fumarylacetoacetate hydrolase family protein [Jiangellaceae bacterium]|nr:fumarylacetoacetate hydrolase family protein [Jiangellaceae bacterium]
MRLANVVDDGRASVAVVRGERILPLALPDPELDSVRAIAAAGEPALRRIAEWAERQPKHAYRWLTEVKLGPAMPDPGAIYTIGLNYGVAGEPDDAGPERPLVYGKAVTSVAGHRSVLTWDRSLTANVDAECELGVIISSPATDVSLAEAMEHVFGYTIINDVSSRDSWLDGDQWLLGKSMPGFCPIGPWIVTRGEVDPNDLRLGCTINGVAIQDGRTLQMRFRIPELIAYLSRHVTLRPGDAIATGTPARLEGPLGPGRLEAGDVVTVWIEEIGELTTVIA